MKILNESTLDQFREQTRCELCNRTVGGCEPHHWYARGMGGGHQMDPVYRLKAKLMKAIYGIEIVEPSTLAISTKPKRRSRR